MKIRVLKCSDSRYWYSDLIGQLLEVYRVEKNIRPDQGIPGDVYWCREGGTYNPINFVLKSDAEEIPMNDLSAFMAEQLGQQLALEKDKILQACVRKEVGPAVRIRDVLIANRVTRGGDDGKSEVWLLDGKPLVQIWSPVVKDEPAPDGIGTRMVASISYRLLSKQNQNDETNQI